MQTINPPPRYGGPCSYIAAQTLSSTWKTLSRSFEQKKKMALANPRQSEESTWGKQLDRALYSWTMLVTGNETTLTLRRIFSPCPIFKNWAKQEQLAPFGFTRYFANLAARIVRSWGRSGELLIVRIKERSRITTNRKTVFSSVEFSLECKRSLKRFFQEENGKFQDLALPFSKKN